MKNYLFVFLSLFLFMSTTYAGTYNSATNSVSITQTTTNTVQAPTKTFHKVEKSQAPKQKTDKEPKTRKRVVALLLCIFLGALGLHRFYMGDTMVGLIQLFTGGGGTLWWLTDLVRLICGGFKSRFQ